MLVLDSEFFNENSTRDRKWTKLAIKIPWETDNEQNLL